MGPLCRLTSARTTASQTGRSTSRPFLLQASSKNRRKGLSATGSQCTSHTRHTTNVSRPAQTGWTSTTADRDHMPRHPAPGPQPAPHLHLGGPTYAKKKRVLSRPSGPDITKSRLSAVSLDPTPVGACQRSALGPLRTLGSVRGLRTGLALIRTSAAAAPRVRGRGQVSPLGQDPVHTHLPEQEARLPHLGCAHPTPLPQRPLAPL